MLHHAFLLPVCASYDFGKPKVILLLGGGGVGGGGKRMVGKREKNVLFWLVQFLQMQKDL
jgi:hypothetical protein